MFDQLAKNVQQIIDNLKPLIIAEMQKSEAEIIDLNVSQLSEGQDSKGKLMPEYRSQEYETYKKSKGSKSNGRYDLQDEGDYVSGVFTEPDEEGLIIDTKDSKRDKFDYLNPLGLQEKNETILANDILTPIQNEIENIFTSELT
jgi:hypothetical protein